MTVSPADDYQVEPYTGTDSWDELTKNAVQIPGADLEIADSLVGIPFVIVRLTFRIGNYERRDDPGEIGDYVSAELITAPEDVIQKRRSRGKIPDTSIAEPASALVVNLAGTGAYRQIVSKLEALRLIILPEGPDGGELGKSRFDTPVRKWQISNYAKIRYTEPDEQGVTSYQSAEFDVRIHAPRGFRISEYDNRLSKDISTYYLA